MTEQPNYLITFTALKRVGNNRIVNRINEWRETLTKSEKEDHF